MHVLEVPPPATGCLGGNGARWRSYRVLGAESPCTCTWCVVRGFLVLVLVLMRLQVHVGWRDKVGTWFLAWVFVIGAWGCIFREAVGVGCCPGGLCCPTLTILGGWCLAWGYLRYMGNTFEYSTVLMDWK